MFIYYNIFYENVYWMFKKRAVLELFEQKGDTQFCLK